MSPPSLGSKNKSSENQAILATCFTLVSWFLYSSTLKMEATCSSKRQLIFLSLILRPTVSRLVCLGIKHSSGAYDQIFITVRHLRVCWCGASSLTRGRVCPLQLLLALASAVILRFETYLFVASYDSRDSDYHRATGRYILENRNHNYRLENPKS
jgi:hypothetical protein